MNYQDTISIDRPFIDLLGTGSVKQGKAAGSSGQHHIDKSVIQYDKPFFEIFLVSMLLTLAPSKAIGMLMPLIGVAWYLLRSGSGMFFKRVVLLTTAATLLIMLYAMHAWIIDVEFVPANALLSFFHYASFLFLLAFPAKISSEKYSYERYAKLVLNIVLFEGCWGIMQKILAPFIAGTSSGDVVEGTINPLSFVFGHSGFSNQFYAINMGFFLIFSLPLIYRQKTKRIHFVVGLTGVVLASVGHVFFSMVLAVIFCYGIFRFRSFLKLLAGCVLILGIVSALVDTATFDKPLRQARMFFDGETPKSQAIEVAMKQVGTKYPSMHIVGLGPGQYSSRAGIIASGTYGALSDLFRGIPFLQFRSAPVFKTYVQQVWEAVARNQDRYGNSTMYRPFFSLLSVYTEFGGIAFLFLLILIVVQLAGLKRDYLRLGNKSENETARHLALVTSVAILFLFFIGMYENYFETPQGVFLGLLLIIFSRSIIRGKLGADQSLKTNLSITNQKTRW